MKELLCVAGTVGIILCGAGAASAQSPDLLQSLSECREINKGKKRLKCFDKAMLQLDAAGAAVALNNSAAGAAPDAALSGVKTQPQRTAETATYTDDDFAREDLPVERKKQRKKQDQNKTLNATAVEVARNKLGRYVIILENGQVWRQIKADTSKLLVPRNLADSPVIIKRRSFGSYQFSFQKDHRAIKVERIK